MDTDERICSYCATRQPVTALARSEAAAWQCLDVDACAQRADAAGLYASSESELALAALESTQGAVAR